MKIAVVFLLALCGSLNAAPPPPTQENCLTQLFKEDAPVLLQTLATVLCQYKIAKENQNAALFEAFLQQVNTLLGKVGCTIDNILGTHVTITLQNAEQEADIVASVLFGFLDKIIQKVIAIVDEIPIVDNIVNVKSLVSDAQNLACNVLQDVIKDVDEILQFLGKVAANLAQRP